MKTKTNRNGLDIQCKKYDEAKQELNLALDNFDIKFKKTFDKFIKDGSHSLTHPK